MPEIREALNTGRPAGADEACGQSDGRWICQMVEMNAVSLAGSQQDSSGRRLAVFSVIVETTG